METRALTLSPDRLLPALRAGIAAREADIAARDARSGAGRVRVTSYMENIGWPELLGYTADQWHDDAARQLELTLRQALCWLDNVADDTVPGFHTGPDVGWYWDMTLFGAEIRHTPDGVPEFLPHLLAATSDLRTLGRFDFAATGAMPRLLAKYAAMQAVNRERYDGAFTIGFPPFHRGPLDIYVQLRGYEAFVDDLTERPAFVADALAFLADARLRFARERAAFLGEALPATTFVADDWVNVPFITPAFFRDVLVPVYARIRAGEGAVTGFHTCGALAPIVDALLAVFPEIATLEVSGWNDVDALDAVVAPRIGFAASVINTVSLSDDTPTQCAKVAALRRAATRRPVSLCAQAIVKLYPTYDETFARLNRFLALAYAELEAVG